MRTQLWQLACLYWTTANLLAFALMGLDKRRARRGCWRISEKALFFFPVLGGSLGGGCWGCTFSTTRPATGIFGQASLSCFCSRRSCSSFCGGGWRPDMPGAGCPRLCARLVHSRQAKFTLAGQVVFFHIHAAEKADLIHSVKKSFRDLLAACNSFAPAGAGLCGSFPTS